MSTVTSDNRATKAKIARTYTYTYTTPRPVVACPGSSAPTFQRPGRWSFHVAMELDDMEGLADWAYRAAGLDPETPAAPLELARRLLGDGRVVPVERCPGLRSRAVLARVGASWRIYVRSRVEGAELRWLTAHELAEWILRRDGCRSERVETLADALAARLIAPRRAAARALRAGLDFPDLAEVFDVTQSCAVLRQGEVSGTPTALVCPHAVYVRGDAYGWPGERELRVLASKPRVPGLRKARLRDDRRRVAMRAG